MKHQRYIYKSFVLLALSFFIASSCSDFTSKDENKINITNQAGQRVFVDAWEVESSNRVEPAPSIEINGTQHIEISEGDKKNINLQNVKGDYSPGQNIRLFVYSANPDNRTANYKNSIRLSWNELKTNGFSILLKEEKERIIAQNFNSGIFSFSPKTTKKGAKNRLIKNLRTSPTIKNTKIAELTARAEQIFSKEQNFNLNVSPEKSFNIKTTKISKNENNTISLFGEAVNGYGQVALVLSDLGITGSLRTKTSLYKISPVANEITSISLINSSGFPEDHPRGELPLGSAPSPLTKNNGPNQSSKSNASPALQSSHAPNGGPSLGVLVVYTQSVVNNTFDLNGLIQAAIDETNVSYGNSNMSQNVYLAHSMQVNYSESSAGDYEDHLYALSDLNDGKVDNIAALRDQYNADVAVLLVNDGAFCGIAYVGAGSSDAYAVVTYYCASGTYTYSFGHEIGHLLGARHDRFVDSNNTPYQYGHGYVDPNENWRTIMAYSDACNGCNRVQYWSNPDINYPPTGQPMGTITYEDNARALGNRKYEFRDFFTLDPPANTSFDNPNADGQFPLITWSANSDPNAEYHVYRCMNTTGYFNSSCYSEVFSIFTSTTSFEDRVVVNDNSSFPAPCESYFVSYGVTAQNHTGESDRSIASTGGGDGCVEFAN